MLSIGMILLVIISCKSQKDMTSLKNGFEIISQSEYGGRESEAYEVITSDAQLKKLYEELSITPERKVDFDKENVVALFMGQNNTGGYSITISEVIVNKDITTVKVKKTSPPGGGMVTMALTNPYCIAVIKKNNTITIE